MKNVLITGGSGFLGSHITKKLVDDDAVENIVIVSTTIRFYTSFKYLNIESKKISFVKGDVRDYSFLQGLFNEYEFDTVIHLGALSEVRKCQENAKLAYDTNVGGTVNLLEVIRLFGTVKAVVVSSSDKAYGQCDLPYKETDPLAGKAIYEVSKSCQDMIAQSYYNNYDIPVVVTRCSNLYGVGDSNFSRIIPNTVRRILNGKSPVIWRGSEESIREYLHVDDATRAYLSLIKNIDVTKGNAYNIGSGEKTSVKNLVEKLIKIADVPVDIDYPEKGFPEIKHQYLDSSKIKKDTDWRPIVKLDDGLMDTIDGYKKIFREGSGND
jgi:CDP-glucose 4,6-dehydratase